MSFKRCLPALKRYVQRKTRRKIRCHVKLAFRRHGRIGCFAPDMNVIYVSRRLVRENPVLAKAVICHELAHASGLGEREARKLEQSYLKKHGTSYHREVRKYV